MRLNGWTRKGAGLFNNPCYSYEKKFGDKTLIIRVERQSGFYDVKVKGESTVMVDNIATLEEAMNFCEVRFGGQ